MLDTQLVLLKEFFQKVDLEKCLQTTKNHAKFRYNAKSLSEMIMATFQRTLVVCTTPCKTVRQMKIIKNCIFLIKEFQISNDRAAP